MPTLPDRLRRRLFRWRSDGQASVVLGQRRIFILPTRSGLLFVVLLVAMLLGAINYQLALAHALVFLLAGIGLVGMVHTFRNLFELRIAPGRAPPVHAGEMALFHLHLHNARPTARPDLTLQVADEPPAMAHLAPGSYSWVAVPVAATRRGWLELPRIRLSTRYPLGLYVAWSYLQPAMRCLIYPTPLATPLPPADAPSPSGDRTGRGGNDDFSGLRVRQPADSLRHVAWKASARDDGERPLLVKQFADGSAERLQLDWRQTDPAIDAETRLSQLCGWVLAAEAAGLSYALALPGSTIPAGYGEAHCRRCLETLALHTP